MISHDDALELACFLVDDYVSDEDVVEDKLSQKFGVDLRTLADLVGALLPLIDVGTSPLTGKRYKGFANSGFWLVKQEIQ